MALIDESEQAFRELLAVMPAVVEHNGLEKPCVSQSLSIKRMQELQNYKIDASTSIVMLKSDFAALGMLQDRVSEMRVSDEMVDGVVTAWGPPLVYVTKDGHPNSATFTLFLQATQ